MKRRSFLSTSFAAAAAPALAFPALHHVPWLEAGERTQNGPIRLSSNENPLGLPPSAADAIRNGLAHAHEYPSLDATLVSAIARKHEIQSDRIIPGAGSTDVLRMAAQAIGETRSARLVVPEPTFEHMEQYAAPFISDVVRVPLRADHALDIDAMKATARGVRGEVLVFLCNPNNPTGTITPCDEIEAWVRTASEKFFFIVDEAYFDFVDDPSYRTLIPFADRPNLIVSRTFSKVYGLAGLRVGYGIGIPETIGRLRRFAVNNTPNHAALTAAIGCIDDQAFIRRSVESNREARRIAQQALAELGLDALPSHTNFIMHRIRGDLGRYRTRMAEAGFRVGRAFPPMLDHNRVSLGTPDQMRRWAATLREFRAKGWV